ncbi:MAG: recombination protein NinB [Betaproteobacteria bacterium]|nr:recombination protein NinB [Betaproteobacteria bacterium]
MVKRIVITGDLSRAYAQKVVSEAPEGYVCEIKERTRTADQNAALHAMLTDISRQVDWAGKRRSVEDWKALMVSAHRLAMKEAGDVVPGLEGEFVQLRKSTASMGVRELGSLLEYVSAWGAMNGVKFRAPERMAA